MALGGVGASTRSQGWLGLAADSASIVPWPARRADEPTSAEPSPFAEIDCLRARLAPDVLAAAEERATKLDVGVDRVLIAGGAINEETYLRALSKYLGVAFEPLEGIPRTLCPVADERLIESAAAGLLPLLPDGDLCLVVAPRGIAARRICGMIERNPQLSRRFRFTTSERLMRFVLTHAGATLAARASNGLKQTWPTLSAAPPRWLSNIMLPASAGLASVIALAKAPAATLHGVDILLALIFLAWLGLRLVGALLSDRRERSEAPANDALPTYTVIAALYREAASVDGLLSAIERLDYPSEKLDVLVAVEADDAETRRALAVRKTRIPLSVIPVPAIGPRTKPKALNVALPFARGTFTVIYDAEDRPEPDQLRRALRRFRNGGRRLACVQARLCIDNTADSWLSRFFTAEYAGQFDVFLPGIAVLGLPIPLGGSSNHFRTACLREIGGWDAYNVTEDADLGMRLARFGYATNVISSTTFEEAPARFGAWLRQRTRWFKGWMQTWLVHMRQPRRLMRELGLAGFLGFQLIVGGNVLAALVHPLFMAGLIYSLANGAPLWHGGDPAVVVMATLYGTTIAIGYGTSAFLGWLGLKRRNLLSTAWVLALTPLHWLLLSLAAWRGLGQLIVAPYAWEKTEHGLARNSRRAAELTRSLLRLERHLTRAVQSGALPRVGRRPTNISAAPPPPRRAAA
jgi:cellulose synthase/poly-beta-1,6-N-acetylglucosamine synthase-like glycosyltransferase